MTNIFDCMEVEEKLGVEFSDKTLLRTAFTHSSFANEKKMRSNENLEFLGDSVLGFVISDYLYQKHMDEKEEQLSLMRSTIVSGVPLAEAVRRLKLDKHIFFIKGAGKIDTPNDKMCEDLFEALVAAIYVDKGLAIAKKFILAALQKELSQKPQSSKLVDFKTKLQEHFQKNKMGIPVYKELSKRGPDNDPIFVCAVYHNEIEIAKGEGRKKKAAEQCAAEAAYICLTK